MSSPLLPPVLRRWPAVLWPGNSATPESVAHSALERIRRDRLFWPAWRSDAKRPRALALSRQALTEARAVFADGDIAVASDLTTIDPERLEAVYGAAGGVGLWAALGGLVEAGPGEVLGWLSSACGRSPWTGEPLSLADAVTAQALLHQRAMAARGPVQFIGMSRWKRRNLQPFLTGPDGPPAHVRTPQPDQPLAVWGAEAPPGALRVEDGFLRSVGLGVRHTPPVSLTIDRLPPYFDTTKRNAFEEVVASAVFTPALLARAAALRERVVALGLTKYNLPGGAALPDAGGRLAVLVPGQVASDASIRLGAREVRDDAALLAATRARFPDAFLLYKPHPDVVTGLRGGAVSKREARRFADAVTFDADATICLAWAERLSTITSLMGFEALLRGKAVSCFGRPFYAGWGLTDDADPPLRAQPLRLEELVAAALILYPHYVDPVSRLPTTPEVVLERLAAMRAEVDQPRARLQRAWRFAVSTLLNLTDLQRQRRSRTL